MLRSEGASGFVYVPTCAPFEPSRKQQNPPLFKAGVLGSVRKTRRRGNSGATGRGSRDIYFLSKPPLAVYVIGVLIVWAIILGGMWLWDRARFHDFTLICGGFLLGMLAMCIAVHLYRWKRACEN